MKQLDLIIEKHLNEVKAGRAWEGKLKRIDDFLKWLYNKDMLTKAEKDKKDTIIRQYYRYYNDGDWPAILSRRGFSKFGGELHTKEAEKELESYLEDFIKSILSKYADDETRKVFKYENMLNKINFVIKQVEENNINGFLDAWAYRFSNPSDEFLNHVEKMKEEFVKFKNLLKLTDPENSNYIVDYAKEKMKENKTWTPELEKMYISLRTGMKDAQKFLLDIRDAILQARDLKLG